MLSGWGHNQHEHTIFKVFHSTYLIHCKGLDKKSTHKCAHDLPREKHMLGFSFAGVEVCFYAEKKRKLINKR